MSQLQSHLLFEKHGVDGLAAGQDHHGEAHRHRHHEAHADHLRHQVGREVHQHVARDLFSEADVAKETHLVQEEEEAAGAFSLNTQASTNLEHRLSLKQCFCSQ